MRFLQLIAASASLMMCQLSAVNAAEESQSAEEIISAGIRWFDEQIRSSDAMVREQAFDAIMVDRGLVEKLLGKKAAETAWPRLEGRLNAMRATTEQGKDQLEQKGKLNRLQLVDLRKQDENGQYRKVIQRIPPEIPIYRAVFYYENGSAGSSTYLVVDGKMRLFRGLERVVEALENPKAP